MCASEMNKSFYPSIQRIVGRDSSFFQSVHFSLLFLNLSLLVVAAVLSKFNFSYFDFKYNQTVLLVVGFIIIIYLGVKKPERSWYARRSLSETIKTLSWRYSCISTPFGDVERDDDTLFLERINESCVESDFVDGFRPSYVMSVTPTAEMIRVRKLSLDDKVSFYVTNRVQAQLRWYSSRAKRNRLFHWFVFSILCACSSMAVVLSFVNEIQSVNDMPTDVLIALSSSLMAWMQSRKYVELTAAYKLTAYEIENARSLVHSISTPSGFNQFVDEMENLFSREHTQWIAKRQV